MGNQESPPTLKFATIPREFVEATESLPTEGARASVIWAATLYVIYGTDDVKLSKPARAIFKALKPELDRKRNGGIYGSKGGNPNLVRRHVARENSADISQTSNKHLTDI